MKIQNALYLIPVPLGGSIENSIPNENLKIIKEIRFFFVESRREAVRFLISSGVNVDECSFFELSEHTKENADLSPFLLKIKDGNAVGVISDAGCPAVGDPGNRAVEEAHKLGFRVIPLVGPSSMILSLMASGLNGQNFAFLGYLPIKTGERASFLRKIESRAINENQTQLFIEAPYRNAKLFDAILKTCRAETRLCVACGLTSEREFVRTLSVAEWKKSPIPPFEKIPTMFLLGK